MRNENIKPGDLVPAAIRAQVYHEALRIIENKERNPTGGKSYHLCFLLPCVLWGLEDVMDKAPNGQDWDDLDTPNMFPEIDDDFITRMNLSVQGHDQANAKRIEHLQNSILLLMP